MTIKERILVVDDEPIERQTLTDILRLEEYQVTAVANGEAAVDYVRSNQVDLIILDLRMPGMGGIDVVKAINQISPDIEIVLLTAHGSMESAIEALRHRVHDYLLKPASPTKILESVKRGLNRRNARLQARSRSQSTTDDEYGLMTLEDGITIDFNRRLIRINNQDILLTPAEGRLLKVFVENIDKVFTHCELVLLVQGYSTSRQEAPEILRPLVSRLRKKIAIAPFFEKRIVSVRGTGYIFVSL